MGPNSSPVPAGNGTSRQLIWWILTLFASMLLLVVSAWAASTNSRITVIEKDNAELKAELRASTARMEAKLDTLLEEMRRRGR